KSDFSQKVASGPAKSPNHSIDSDWETDAIFGFCGIILELSICISLIVYPAGQAERYNLPISSRPPKECLTVSEVHALPAQPG
ncbi:MAG TPA: hypothetical protein VK885_08815, partial [Desulfotignum sp.]|nr:hypothetical protein [Desulfotignum sp.]